jgi:hypothetical protein
MVLAMAQWQSTRPEEARNAPAKGLEIIDTKLPKPESGDMSMGSPKVPAVPASVLNQSSETGISSRQQAAGNQSLTLDQLFLGAVKK